MSSLAILSRPCACNCGRRFTPPAGQPGRAYIKGHKKFGRPPEAARQDAGPPPKLNYQFALASARKQAEVMASAIDEIDDGLEMFRGKVTEYQQAKDAAIEKHEQLMRAIEVLESLIG